jgi:hypothetical protein
MINRYRYLLKWFLFFCAIFQEKNRGNIFQYDPYSRFPVTWAIGSLIGLAGKYITNNPNSIFTKKFILSRDMFLGGLVSMLSYEIFYRRFLFLTEKYHIRNDKEKANCEINSIYRDEEKNIKRINIFVHGSLIAPEGIMRPSGPRPSFTGFIRSMKQVLLNNIDVIENRYKKTEKFQIYKNRKFLFYENKFPFIAGINPGLEKISNKTITDIAFNKIYKKFIDEKSKEEISFMFNWDGDLSEKSRIFSGAKLRQNILQLKKDYPEAVLYLYGHSHGANVILESLISEKKKDNKKTSEDNDLHINSIYFLGAPIRKKTNEILNSLEKNTFKQLFNIYSDDDYVQTSDFIFAFPDRPSRIIISNKNNIFNIKLEINGKKIQHEDFFVFFKNHENSSALVKFLHDFEKTISEEENETIFTYSLDTSTGIFTKNTKK